MKRLLLSCLPAAVLLAAIPAAGDDSPDAETAGGWVKYEKNPVLGGSLGTCFDVLLGEICHKSRHLGSVPVSGTFPFWAHKRTL